MRKFAIVAVVFMAVLQQGCEMKRAQAANPPPPPRPAVEIDKILETATQQYATGDYEGARKALYALHEELKAQGSPRATEVDAQLSKAACAIQLPEAAEYFKAWPAKRKVLERHDASSYTRFLVDLVMPRMYLGCIEKSPADVVAKLIPKAQRAPQFIKQVNQDLARQEARADKIKAYFDSCGEKPKRWFDGGVIAAENLMKQNAHDPDSIDVENCTEPVLMTRGCWQYRCEVRGKNAFGAMVLNHVTFRESAESIRSGQ